MEINVCSYAAEIIAMNAAVKVLAETTGEVTRVLNDSQAIVIALQGNIRHQTGHLKRLANAVYENE